jgi:toxin ParE1/3/4
MRFNVSILAEAEVDIDNAYVWYELRQVNLGNKFFKKVEESVQFISNNPYCCKVLYKGIRRHIVKKFPYAIYYKVNFEFKEIQIVGVIHFKRSSRVIKKRSE